MGVEEDESNYRNDTGHQHPEIISSIKKMTGRKKHSEAKSTVPDFYNFCEQQLIKKSSFFGPYYGSLAFSFSVIAYPNRM